MEAMDVLEYVYEGEGHQRTLKELTDHFGSANTSRLLRILDENTNHSSHPWFERDGSIYSTTNHAPIADLKRFKK